MLRNNLSTFVRTLRRDMAQATVVKSVSGTAFLQYPFSGYVGAAGAECGQQRKYDYPYCQGRHFVYHPRSHLYYILFPLRGRIRPIFLRQEPNAEGKFTRLTSNTSYPSCSSYASGELVLDNVKWISGTYSVPYFNIDTFSRGKTQQPADGTHYYRAEQCSRHERSDRRNVRYADGILRGIYETE